MQLAEAYLQREGVTPTPDSLRNLKDLVLEIISVAVDTNVMREMVKKRIKLDLGVDLEHMEKIIKMSTLRNEGSLRGVFTGRIVKSIVEEADHKSLALIGEEVSSLRKETTRLCNHHESVFSNLFVVLMNAEDEKTAN